MKPRVLIAEADESLQPILTYCLSRKDFETDGVGSGLECLRRLRTGQYEALVLSRELPWGEGDGVLAVMRQEPELAQIPVVLTSTLSTAEELSQLPSPVVLALRKPFSIVALADSLRSAVAGRRPSTPAFPSGQVAAYSPAPM